MPTYNTYRYSLGVIFDGVGDDTSETGGIAWAYGPTPTGASNYEWKANHLVRLPESVDTSVNPLSGEFSTSAFDFELSMNDDVATTFLHQSTSPEYKIGLALTAAGTSVTVLNLAGTGVSLTGQAVWIGDECILLGSYSGSGVHTGCTRGFWNTYAITHIVDTYIHTAINYWRFRGVRLVVHDRDDATERTVWRGWVDSMGTSDDGTTLNVSCTEVLQSLQGAEVNRGADQLASTAHVGVTIYRHGDDIRAGGSGLVYARRVRKSAANYAGWYQLDDVLINGTYVVATSTAVLTGFTQWESSDALTDSDLGEVEKIYEVLAVDSLRATSESSTGALTRPFHPIEIAMALLTSTRSETVNVGAQAWDALSGEWGLGLPLDFFDLTQIQTLIESTADLKIRRLLLGWDGDAVDVLDVVNEKLLKPYGFYISVTTEGQIAFRELRLFDVTEFNASTLVAVSALPTLLKQDAARSNAVQQVIATVGELPWRDPDMLSVMGRDNTLTDSLRSALFGEKVTYELDFSTQASEEDVRVIALDRLKYAYYAMPRTTIRVDDALVSGADFDLGAVVVPIIDTQKGWFVKNDGTRAAATGDGVVDSQFAGVVVGRTLTLSNMTYTLSLLLTNYRQGGAVYLRAPSGVVASVSGPPDDTLVLEANTFHASATDASKFTVGDSVAFFTPAGVARAELHEIISITSNTIVLDNTAVTIAAGDIMRLDDWDHSRDYPDSEYNFLADANGKLGAGDEDGRRYA